MCSLNRKKSEVPNYSGIRATRYLGHDRLKVENPTVAQRRYRYEMARTFVIV
jgi:hypothetical protein